jgi:hypothetical protein
VARQIMFNAHLIAYSRLHIFYLPAQTTFRMEVKSLTRVHMMKLRVNQFFILTNMPLFPIVDSNDDG